MSTDVVEYFTGGGCWYLVSGRHSMASPRSTARLDSVAGGSTPSAFNVVCASATGGAANVVASRDGEALAWMGWLVCHVRGFWEIWKLAR